MVSNLQTLRQLLVQLLSRLKRHHLADSPTFVDVSSSASKKNMGSGASSSTISKKARIAQKRQPHLGVVPTPSPFPCGLSAGNNALLAREQHSQRSNRSNSSKASKSSLTNLTRQCSRAESTHSPPHSPADSLSLGLGGWRKKNVSFGAHEVLLLDEDSGTSFIQSYQIDGMMDTGKESSDLGVWPSPPPHPFAPDHELEDGLD
eukprot:s2664_g4.t1